MNFPEQRRLEELQKYHILDSMPERDFDELTTLASMICETPIALVCLIDENRQWFKSKHGLTIDETARDIAFCAHAIQQDELFIVEDTYLDQRFVNNPLVTGDPFIRFYAGAPLISIHGFRLGTLCVIDTVPRQLTESQKTSLEMLANQAMSQLNLRYLNYELKTIRSAADQLVESASNQLRNEDAAEEIITVCSSCKCVKDVNKQWPSLEEYIGDRFKLSFSHGICPDCRSRLYPRNAS